MLEKNPNIRARCERIESLNAELKIMLPTVLSETGIRSLEALHGIYGGKFDVYMNSRTDIVYSPDELITRYMTGLLEKAKTNNTARCHLKRLRECPTLRKYLFLFLERMYYRNFDALRRVRPENDEDAQIWIGQNNADWGILITPRFNETTQQWENDGSEIRHFPCLYWTIGHVLRTGLVVPGKNNIQSFTDVENYLQFFLNVLVRNSGSPHEYKLASIYYDYVVNQEDADSIPLLIPEYRYGGISPIHRYRLDFTIINPYSLAKYGFELSPWSTHGKITGTKAMTQKRINDIAQGHFENEMEKQKEFFNLHHIFTRIYTDKDLADLDLIFNRDMIPILSAKPTVVAPDYAVVDQILGV